MSKTGDILYFKDVIISSFKIARKYKFNVILSYFLWLITFWIPYFNIGTTIGLKKMILKMSQDDSISPIDIFSSEHRENIDIFLILYFISSNIIIIASSVFLVIPGYVMYFALSQIYLLFIDKNLGAMESIRESYRITYGEKWHIFFSKLFGMIGIYIIGSIVTFLLYAIIFYPMYGYLSNADEKHWEWNRTYSSIMRDIQNNTYDINSYKESINEYQEKIDYLPKFKERYGWYNSVRTITLDKNQADLKELEFNDEIFEYKVKIKYEEAELVSNDLIKEELESNEPSVPFMSPWSFYYFVHYIILPVLMSIVVLFSFVYNASMNAYIYNKLKNK